MSIQFYLSRCGFSADAFAADFYQQVSHFQQQLAALKPAAEVQWQFQVPELGEGGSCSLFGTLSDVPYDLRPILGGETDANLQLLAKVTAIVQFYQANSASDWFGVYQRRVNPAGDTFLVGIGYAKVVDPTLHVLTHFKQLITHTHAPISVR